MPISRIADLPIHEREPLDLLALTDERLAVDRDYGGFGWAWVDGLELSAPARPSLWLPRALVLALHSADEQPDADDVELEFEVDGEIVRAPLSKLLAVQLSRLPPSDDVVLALCNPNDAPVRVPVGVVDRRIHYAFGDVTSWLDHDRDETQHIRLTARRWMRSDS